MNWLFFVWTFRLKSPLYVGFHKIMHFYRTRPYVTGKLLWAALTAKLTPLLGLNDYEKVGGFLKKTMWFGYLFPYVEGSLFYPKYTDNGLKFGELFQNDFERKFISSMASTAIEAETYTAEEGMLHEVEFINPYTVDEGKPVFFKGLVWVKVFSDNGFNLSINNNEIKITYKGISVNFKSQLANRFQIGGERKYGFGLLELQNCDKVSNNKCNELPGEWSEKGGEICISIPKDNFIWSHVLHSDNLNIKGNIEPLVFRDWKIETGAGKKLTSYGLCWVPGSVLCENIEFKVNEFGIWEKKI